MEPALVLTIAAGGLLLVLLAGDLLVTCVSALASVDQRWRHVVAKHAAWFTALVIATAVGRPIAAGAATPPPHVRMVGPTTPRQAPAEPGEGSSLPDLGLARETTYVVEKGDCLWTIAKGLLVTMGVGDDGPSPSELWRRIYEANRALIGADPDLIHPGQVLTIPEV